MRGIVPGLESPRPLIERLPGVLQEDQFLQRLMPAFDAAVAPVISTLDCLAAYIDPWLSPPDFLDWLAGWVGVDPDDAWTTKQRRSVVAAAAQVYRRSGTAGALAEALRLTFDAEVEVAESGGCAWSAAPGTALPGQATPSVSVRLRVADPAAVDPRRVEALLEQNVPAHVPASYELIGREAAG